MAVLVHGVIDGYAAPDMECYAAQSNEVMVPLIPVAVGRDSKKLQTSKTCRQAMADCHEVHEAEGGYDESVLF